jgi:hypothetical protein
LECSVFVSLSRENWGDWSLYDLFYLSIVDCLWLVYLRHSFTFLIEIYIISIHVFLKINVCLEFLRFIINLLGAWLELTHLPLSLLHN